MRNGMVKTALLMAVLLAAQTGASTQGRAAGLFEFLFGRSERTQFAPAPSDALPDFSDAQNRPARPARQKPVEAKVIVGPQPKISIFEDKTLRPGDAVAMEDGIRIFVGSATFPYDKEDFVPVEQSKRVAKASRPDLIALSASVRYY